MRRARASSDLPVAAAVAVVVDVTAAADTAVAGVMVVASEEAEATSQLQNPLLQRIRPSCRFDSLL